MLSTGGLVAAKSPPPQATAWWQAPWVALFVIAAFALAWRVHTFGNPTLHVDDQFYVLVGQQMHEGLLPYVDVWDRKPFGLFLIYYAIAGFSFAPEAYQIAAWLFASLTGFAIYLCSRHWASGQGAVFAGILYIAALHISGGEGGQAPVFYNLFVALAALLLLSWSGEKPQRADYKVWLAMASLGLGITIKQTVLFEAAAMGLFVLWRLWRSGAPMPQIARTAAVAMALGAAPTLACFAFFAATGHLAVFWHAMIVSNAAKAYPDLAVIGWRALLRIIVMMPMLVPAIISWIGPTDALIQRRGFLTMWMAATLVGFVAVPNFYLHYLLPLWVPICVIASGSLDRRWLGPALLIGCVSFSALSASPFNREWAELSAREVAAAAQTINEVDDGDTMLVFEGPPALYQMTGRRFLSPLVFPTHLSWMNESDTSHIETVAEVRRILEQRPDVVVTLLHPRSEPANKAAWKLVRGYVLSSCLIHREAVVPEIYRRWRTLIHARCGRT